jgi:hypothetical protein
MPEIAVAIGEFDRDLPPAARFRIDVHDATFALFFGEAIDDPYLLAEFYARFHLEQPAM